MLALRYHPAISPISIPRDQWPVASLRKLTPFLVGLALSYIRVDKIREIVR